MSVPKLRLPCRIRLPSCFSYGEPAYYVAPGVELRNDHGQPIGNMTVPDAYAEKSWTQWLPTRSPRRFKPFEFGFQPAQKEQRMCYIRNKWPYEIFDSRDELWGMLAGDENSPVGERLPTAGVRNLHKKLICDWTIGLRKGQPYRLERLSDPAVFSIVPIDKRRWGLPCEYRVTGDLATSVELTLLLAWTFWRAFKEHA